MGILEWVAVLLTAVSAVSVVCTGFSGAILMSNGYFILLAAFMLTLFGATFPFGAWLVRIERGLPGAGLLGRVESAVYRLCGVDPAEGMSWYRYAIAVLVFNFLGVLAVYALQRTQAWLPLNPQGFGNVTAGLGVQHRGRLREQHELAGLWR